MTVFKMPLKNGRPAPPRPGIAPPMNPTSVARGIAAQARQAALPATASLPTRHVPKPPSIKKWAPPKPRGY